MDISPVAEHQRRTGSEKKAAITMERQNPARKFLQQPQPKFKRCWMTQKSLLCKAKMYKILLETMI
jgi:hypothetical protein